MCKHSTLLIGTIVCRFVDRDMLMRYHWGLGIGHYYSHVPEGLDGPEQDDTSDGINIGFDDLENDFDPDVLDWEQPADSDTSNGLLYEVSEDITEGMDSDSSLEDDEGEDLDDEDSDWDEMYEMYGSDWDGDQSD